MLLIKVAGGLVLVVLILAFVLRGRFGTGRMSPKKDERPTLPPSPYQPSRGFRILDGEEPVASHPVPMPQLDPLKEFVINGTTAAEPVTPHLRHDEQWALARSMRHAPHPRVRRRRRVVIAVGIVLLAAALVAVLWLGSHPASHHAGLVVPYAGAPISWRM